MGLFSSPPGPDLPPLPDIPVADFTTQAKQQVQGAKDGGWWSSLVATWWAGFVLGATRAIGFLVSGLDEVLALVVTFVTAMQGNRSPGMYALVAGIMSDLLGVEISQDKIQASFQTRGELAAMTSAGQLFYDQLAKEFSAGQQPGKLVASLSSAQSFLGFLITFSVRQGNLALISELIPEEFNFMGGIREYGEILARSLGLGRLARRALQPLVQTLVGDPLQWALNEQYRPKLLGASELVRAYYRNALPLAVVEQQMRWHGYSDAEIAALFIDHGKLWTPSEIMDLVRKGELTEDQAIQKLEMIGMGLDDATATWSSAKFSLVSPLTHLLLSELNSQARAGFLDQEAAYTLIDGQPLLFEEKAAWKKLVDQTLALPRRHLTESELERAYLEGMVLLTDIQQAWKQLGYSDPAIQILSLLLLNKQTAGQKTAKGHVAHKSLTEAQLEKAYNSGVLDLVQLQAGWHALGYSDADQQVLTQLVQIKTPGPGSTTLPGVTTP